MEIPDTLCMNTSIVNLLSNTKTSVTEWSVENPIVLVAGKIPAAVTGIAIRMVNVPVSRTITQVWVALGFLVTMVITTEISAGAVKTSL